MGFSETVKLMVKQKAHFRCCLCHDLFVEVHHIMPQKENGSDDIENAAPLCSKCHSDFGGNPNKRKSIREIRDFWYELCEKRELAPDISEFNLKIDNLYIKMQEVASNQTEQKIIINDMANHISDFYGGYSSKIRNSGDFQQLSGFSGIITSGATNESVSRCKVYSKKVLKEHLEKGWKIDSSKPKSEDEGTCLIREY